mgnify:CR=1 FL=1
MSEEIKKKENWRARYEATRKKIAEIREQVDLNENPQYFTGIKETKKEITIEREPYSLVFDKKRAMVTKANITDVKLGNVCLPHLLVIDDKGRELKQFNSTKGDLKVREEKFSVFLEGFFTLDGKAVPIVYEIDRMTGTTFCTMDVPGPLKVRRMTLEHSLGRTPRPLDTFYAPHHYLKQFKPYKPVVINEYKIDLIFEKDTIQLWTDGNIGFQVYSISWDKSKVLDTEKKFRYGTGEIRNNTSWIDLTFFSTGTKDAIDLPDGYRATCAFSPMPFKKWRPKSGIFGSTYLFPPVESGIYKKGEEMEAVYNHFGRNGVTFVCSGESHGCNDPVDPEYTKWMADASRRNGVEMILYIERSLTNVKRQPMVGMLTEEEIENGKQKLKSHFGDKNDGCPQWGDSSPMCCNYEPWRIHMLTMIDYHLTEMNFDGVYLDSSFICSCHNTKHGESPDESTSVRGSMIFQQDLRLLLDYYAKKNNREYHLINHYWDQHVAPVAGVSDYTMPGEQDAYKFHRKMSPENIIYGYSALPNGVNVIWYSSMSYDYTSPQIYNDAADCGAIIWLSPYLESMVQYPPQGILKHIKHVQPLVQYNLSGSRPVHRFTKEYAKIFKGGDKQTRATLYFKDDSVLVYLVNDGPKSKKTSFSLKLHKAWKKCLVLNATDLVWTDETPVRGTLTMKGIDCSRGPIPVIIRPMPQKPELVWRDNISRSLDFCLDGNKVLITGKGVAGACSACFVHMPEGKALARAGRVLGKLYGRIYIVQIVFNSEGKGMIDLDVVDEPPPVKEWQWPPLED